MHKLEKSPGMFSDYPGTTPKILDLVVSLTCLRDKERELLDVCGLVEGSERDIQYKSSLADPHLSVQSRTVRDIPADRPPLNLYIAARLTLPLLNSAQPLADRT